MRRGSSYAIALHLRGLQEDGEPIPEPTSLANIIVLDAATQFSVIIERAANNYSAYLPDLPGCITTGPTVEETLANMREAIEFHLEGMREDGDPIPGPTSIAATIMVAA